MSGPPAGDRVHADLRVLASFELPDLVALRGFHDPGRPLGEPRRDATTEGVDRLDDMIVDRDDGSQDLTRLRFGKKQRWIRHGARHSASSRAVCGQSARLADPVLALLDDRCCPQVLPRHRDARDPVARHRGLRAVTCSPGLGIPAQKRLGGNLQVRLPNTIPRRVVPTSTIRFISRIADSRASDPAEVIR